MASTSIRHYARDALQNPLNSVHQRRTWPLQCAESSDPQNAPSFEYFFAPTVQSDDLFICCIPLLPPEMIPDDDSEIDVVPVIFTMIGQIAREDCFLTAEGDQRVDRPDHQKEGPLASCWLESRPDRDSCLEWRHVPSAIERIESTAVARPLNLSRVLRFFPNEGAVQLRLRFAPYHGELKDTLPVFDTRRSTNVTRWVPSNIGEVPFDRPLRASFTLEHVRDGDESFLFADLVTLETI
ncbi:hypothetical protein VTO73DRAFT_10230 [Trametes versicolor]